MREKFSLTLEEPLITQLINGDTTVSGFLESVFGKKGSANYIAMCEGLVAYHNKDGGSPEVTEFDITESSFKPATLSGAFKCSFAVHFHYTCSDIHNNAKDTIRWDFKLGDKANTVMFIGEEPWIRDAE
ncbi:MAG: hypothetical protein JWR05_3342 [Mucilaginibacter sp.]|nr:hypothetical protein [Mucilaginibacter sp.]